MNSFEIIAYPLLPVAAMELLLGFLLLTQNSRSAPAHRSVAAIAFFSAAYALNTSVMYLMASRGLDFNFFARLNWIGWLALPAGLQFLFRVKSETDGLVRRKSAFLYVFWAAVLALCLFTDQIVTPGYSLIPYENDPGPLEVPVRLAGAAMTIWLIVEIIRTRRRLTGARRVQLNFFFCGLLVYSVTGVAIAGVMPSIGGFAVEPGLGAYFSLPWVVFTFYAIVRYSLFELRVILSRTLASITLVLISSGVQLAVLSAVAPALGVPLAVIVSLALLGFFLVGTPVTRKVQSLTDSLIVGKRYHYESLIREAIVTLNAKKKTQEVVDYVLEAACAGLAVTDAGIYLYRVEDGFILREGRERYRALKDQARLADIAVKKLQETNRPIVLAEMTGTGEEDQDTFQLTTYLRGTGTEALVPLLFQGRLQGALAAGRKTNGEAFGQSDVAFLETLAAHAASALENARLSQITREIRSSLQESEERFMALAQKLPAAVFIYRGGAILFANEAAAAMTGYQVDQLAAMQVSGLFFPESRGFVLNQARATGEQRLRQGQELQVLCADGTQRRAVMTSAVIEYGEQAAVIAVLFDVTDIKRTEGRLRHERIREAVGRMAAYLAGDLERLAKDLRMSSSLQEYEEETAHDPEWAGRLQAAAGHAEYLVRTIREFSTRKEPKRSPQNIGELIVKRRQILAALLTGKFELVLRLSPEPLLVSADPARLENMLMNLVLSARDRMTNGGAITIAAGRVLIDAAFIRRTGYGRIGPYAAVSVTDTADSMTSAEQERIFEPFFGIQEGWQGNGMGLSLVYDIVKEHEGYITLLSRQGEGNSYIAYLPLMQGHSLEPV